MFHIIEAVEAQTADRILQGMFAARKSVFVDLLRWNVPVLAGKYEIDQFDDAHAVYLILADDRGEHLGSARLLPSTRPHILDSIYPDLCGHEPPRGPAIREITRFCLDRRLRAARRRSVRDTLVCAIADYGIATGTRSYTAIAEMAWLQQILAFGWRCSPLGLPRMEGGAMLAALRIDIDADTPAQLRAAGLQPERTLIDAFRRAA